jgi:hypothetical protein
MIADRNRTPFNIGRAIALDGFQLDEAQPLAQGLAGIAADPEVVLREVLNWTGGQPFLTQKLCSLIAANNRLIPRGREAKAVEAIVKTKILSNWQSQDEPEHLRTIRDRLLGDELYRLRLLQLYRQVLLKGTRQMAAPSKCCCGFQVWRYSSKIRSIPTIGSIAHCST